jgi:hypothetical protein
MTFEASKVLIVDSKLTLKSTRDFAWIFQF